MLSSSDLLFDMPTLSSIAITGVTILVLLVTYAVYTREFTPLRNIPGPFIASISRFWIFQKQRGYQRQQLDIDLHKKYGPIVRISPNEVMVASPKSMRTIYGAGSKFRKGDWYIATSDCGWSGPDTLDFLPEMNMEKYRIQRRVTGQAYTESAMKDVEGNIDTILEKNINIMRERTGQSTNVDVFFNFFALDCLSMSTFSVPKGIVEAGKDDGSVTAVHNAWLYMHLVGFFPWVHRFNAWFVNYIIAGWMSKIKGLPIFLLNKNKDIREVQDNIFSWAIKQLKPRMELKDKISLSEPATDIAGKLLQIQAEKPLLKDHWLTNMTLTNFGAGVETIGITVSTLVCKILDNPGCQEKIQAEIDAALKSGKLSKTPKLRDMQEHLPYLSACVSESMRLHPVIGMPLPRVVPDGGVELEGHFLPSGTDVGLNPWVLSRDKSLYGEDASEWRPERWLEYSSTQLRYLETYNMSFGTGARSCPGKQLAQAIYTKMIPMLFMNFDWSYVDPTAERKTRCTFSTRLIDVMVQWKVREGVVE